MAGGQAERAAERIALRSRQPLESIEHRRAQLMQPRESKLHLGLDTRGVSHATPRRVPADVLEQRRLAHARLPAKHERAALAGPNRLHQAVERRGLAAPAEQPSLGDRAGHGLGTNLHREPERANGAAEAAPSSASHAGFAPRFSTLAPPADSASHKTVSPSPLVWPFLVSFTNV